MWPCDNKTNSEKKRLHFYQQFLIHFMVLVENSEVVFLLLGVLTFYVPWALLQSYSKHEIETYFLFSMDTISFYWPCVSMAINIDVRSTRFSMTDVVNFHFGTDGSAFLVFSFQIFIYQIVECNLRKT